ncbi:cytochrome c [Paenibacillus sp. J2TS4]|uniref:c-type cytochrome n=1 Tax=Paenibacillus sp. J2TS4 TaxID=2807194 RepID=UPI0020BF58D6|nr:cytochrome c [Paenibacillus sp. J2TS4]
MKAKLTSSLIVVIVLLVTACSKETDNQVKSETMNGPADANAAALYKKQCISCHAADLSGKVGPDLRGIGATRTEEELVEIIQDGSKGMPAFQKILSVEEIEALAQWLSTNK